MVSRADCTFLHGLKYELAPIALGKSTASFPDTEAIAVRIIEAFRRSDRGGASSNKDSLWQEIESAYHAKFLSCLRSGDAKALASYLDNIFEEAVLHGLDQSGDQSAPILSGKRRNLLSPERGMRAWKVLPGKLAALLWRPDGELFYASHCMDRLACLAEALGCLNLENPEQGRWAENLYLDPDELVGRIEECLGIDVTPPEIASGRFGLKTRKGLFSYRDINSLYTAWRIKELLCDVASPAVCEIGAGMGKAAYYCHRLGIRSYTIVDLPQVNAVQAFYLLRSLPEAGIQLHGEPGSRDGIKILPYWEFPHQPDGSFDLVLNQDSFPEMGLTAALEYLDLIKVKSKFFLSINHEAEPVMTPQGQKQHVVGELTRQAGGYRRVYRFPFWLRRGYVEELYESALPCDLL